MGDKGLMLPDVQQVSRIIRDTAAKEILPRFGHLADHEVTEKTAGELVTAADIEAERVLGAALGELVAGSIIVGEEGTETDPGLLNALSGPHPAWIIDPVDGTRNFVEGKPCFAVIVAFCLHGETQAGWIYDPISDSMITATAGGGAWEDGKPLQLAPPAQPMAKLSGSLGSGPRKRLRMRREAGERNLPSRITRYGCVGREYMDLARGSLHFARYAQHLKPWDHAAGVLIHREAGGANGLVEGRTQYTPARNVAGETLILAPDTKTWESLRQLLSV
jgi:fructose-1,6-bisphosphatase/inositol monophosphatase family enzyme